MTADLPLATRRHVCPDHLDVERAAVFDKAWLLVGTSDELEGPGTQRSVAWRRDQRLMLERQDARVDVRAPFPVATRFWRGLVWASAAPQGPGLEDYLGPLVEELEPYQLSDFVPIRTRTMELECNWKAPLEISMETYHLERVHAGSIAGLMAAQPPCAEALGDHQRMIAEVADYAWRRWIDRRSTRGGPYEGSQRYALYRYLVFPNTIINVLPSQLSIYTTWPLGPDRCRLEYRFCARQGAGPVEWTRTRLTAWLSARILEEDLAVLRRFQQGVHKLSTGPGPLHGREAPIAWFHQTLDRWMADSSAFGESERVTGVR